MLLTPNPENGIKRDVVLIVDNKQKYFPTLISLRHLIKSDTKIHIVGRTRHPESNLLAGLSLISHGAASIQTYSSLDEMEVLLKVKVVSDRDTVLFKTSNFCVEALMPLQQAFLSSSKECISVIPNFAETLFPKLTVFGLPAAKNVSSANFGKVLAPESLDIFFLLQL